MHFAQLSKEKIKNFYVYTLSKIKENLLTIN